MCIAYELGDKVIFENKVWVCTQVDAGGKNSWASGAYGRLAEFEKKVDKHNSLVERMALAEASTKSAHHRLDELQREG